MPLYLPKCACNLPNPSQLWQGRILAHILPHIQPHLKTKEHYENLLESTKQAAIHALTFNTPPSVTFFKTTLQACLPTNHAHYHALDLQETLYPMKTTLYYLSTKLPRLPNLSIQTRKRSRPDIPTPTGKRPRMVTLS